MPRLRVFIAAEEAGGVRALRLLHESAVEVVGVVTGEHSAVPTASVADLAHKLGLKVHSPEHLRDPSFANAVTATGADLFLNVHSLVLVHDDVLQAAHIGSFNLHPGPLPSYAGLNTPSWGVYNGESTFAATLHWMEGDVDTGPIAYQESFPLAEDETALGVSSKCVAAGLRLLARLVSAAQGSPVSIPRMQQELRARRWFDRRQPGGGVVDWTSPAADVLRLVRACYYYPLPAPWPYPLAELGPMSAGLVKAQKRGAHEGSRPGEFRIDAEGRVTVAAADEWVEIQLIEKDGSFLRPSTFIAPGAPASGQR
jgi:methionyl-tRNA formyltransferase